jgi:hypothetical protein
MTWRVAPAQTGADLEDARALMRRYAEWTGVNLCFQNFDAELAALPGKYVPRRAAVASPRWRRRRQRRDRRASD